MAAQAAGLTAIYSERRVAVLKQSRAVLLVISGQQVVDSVLLNPFANNSVCKLGYILSRSHVHHGRDPHARFKPVQNRAGQLKRKGFRAGYPTFTQVWFATQEVPDMANVYAVW